MSQEQQKCQKCNAEIPPKSNFCLNCGEKIEAPPAPQEAAAPDQSTNACQCGETEAQPEGGLCPKCGGKRQTAVPGPRPEEYKKNMRNCAIGCLGIVAIILAIGAIQSACKTMSKNRQAKIEAKQKAEEEQKEADRKAAEEAAFYAVSDEEHISRFKKYLEGGKIFDAQKYVNAFPQNHPLKAELTDEAIEAHAGMVRKLMGEDKLLDAIMHLDAIDKNHPIRGPLMAEYNSMMEEKRIAIAVRMVKENIQEGKVFDAQKSLDSLPDTHPLKKKLANDVTMAYASQARKLMKEGKLADAKKHIEAIGSGNAPLVRALNTELARKTDADNIELARKAIELGNLTEANRLVDLLSDGHPQKNALKAKINSMANSRARRELFVEGLQKNLGPAFGVITLLDHELMIVLESGGKEQEVASLIADLSDPDILKYLKNIGYVRVDLITANRNYAWELNRGVWQFGMMAK
jgi:hypothetical protein